MIDFLLGFPELLSLVHCFFRVGLNLQLVCIACGVICSVLVDGPKICGQVALAISEATCEKYLGLVAPLGPFAFIFDALGDFVASAQGLKHV